MRIEELVNALRTSTEVNVNGNIIRVYQEEKDYLAITGITAFRITPLLIFASKDGKKAFSPAREFCEMAGIEGLMNMDEIRHEMLEKIAEKTGDLRFVNLTMRDLADTNMERLKMEYLGAPEEALRKLEAQLEDAVRNAA